jgi:hypothetical protein
MAKPNAIVGGIADFAPVGEAREPAPKIVPSQRLAATFEDGRTAFLDISTHRGRVWADVLSSLRESNQPAYVEIDPTNNLITELLLPVRYTVARVTKIKGGREIELIPSHARHFLRQTHPDFAAMTEMVERAHRSGGPLLVTETLDRSEIIDVRPVPGEPSSPPRPRRRRQK